jgi:muconolactone delta-isomerase
MKYLMIAKMKKSPSMPEEEFLKSVVKEWETALKIKGMKNVETVYALSDWSGGIAIFDADSKAQAKALMTELPFYKYLDFKFSSIVSAEKRLAEAKHNLEVFRAKMVKKPSMM